MSISPTDSAPPLLNAQQASGSEAPQLGVTFMNHPTNMSIDTTLNPIGHDFDGLLGSDSSINELSRGYGMDPTATTAPLATTETIPIATNRSTNILNPINVTTAAGAGAGAGTTATMTPARISASGSRTLSATSADGTTINGGGGGGGGGGGVPSGVSEIKLRRFLEYNQRLREQLNMHRIPVSEASQSLIQYVNSTADALLPSVWGSVGSDPFAKPSSRCCNIG